MPKTRESPKVATVTETPPRALQDDVSAFLTRLLEGCWLAVVGLLPLFFIPGLLRPFYPPKAMLLQVLALVMLATVISRWLAEGRGVTGADVRALLRSRVHLAAIVFALVALIATLMSLSPWTSLVGSVNRRQGLLTILSWVVFFMVLSTNLRTSAQLKRLIIVLLVSSGLVSIIGIIEHYVPSFSHWFLSTSYTQRSAATTGNGLSLSGYLGMSIPFTIATGVMVYRRMGRLRRPGLMLALLGALLAAQLWCLVLSIYSFVLLLYLVPAALFVALFALLALRRRAVSLTALALLAAVIIAGGVIVLPQWQNAAAGTPPHAPGTPLPADTPERLTGTLYGRARYWVYAMDVLPQAVSDPQPGDSAPILRPLIGYGPETYTLVTQRHFPPEYVSAQTNAAAFRDRAHNHFIYLAITTGFLGLAAWLVLVAGCGVLLYRTVRRAGPSSATGLYGLAAGCAIAGFLAHGVFNPIALTEEALVWMCLALAPTLAALHDGRTTDPDVHGQPGPVSTPPRYRTAFALLLVVVAVAGGAMSARNPLLAEAAMRDAIVMSASGNPNTVFMYSQATNLQPREPTYWGALGAYAHSIALRAQGEAKATILELSLIALRQARDNEPLLAFWHYQLGDALLYAASSTGQSTAAEAVESYERALELSPRNAVIAGRLAVAHMVAGDLSPAAHTLSWAAQYDPEWSRTDHLKVAFTALTGNGDMAAQALLSLVRESPAQLGTFAHVAASQLLAYGLVEPMSAAMQPALEAQSQDYASLSVRGILTALAGDPADAADLLTSAIESAPAEATVAVQNATRYLVSFVPGLADALTQ
jgi:tetratricopeptide (TPR) repeat protein